MTIPSNVQVTTCNHNYSEEGIYHPDRIMNEYDLLYMVDGVWDICEDAQCYHVEKDQVLLLEPGKHHYSDTKCTPKMRNMYIHFALPATLQGPASPNSIATSESSATSDASASSLVLGKLTDCSGNYEVRHLYEKIIETYWSMDSACRRERLQALLTLLLCELAELEQNIYQPVDVLIQEILHRFSTSSNLFFRPDELAMDYGLSLRSLTSRFRRATGQSIHQYQIQLKLKMAYDLIPRNPGRGLRDIALSLGFYDEFQFSKLFKREYGISPSERRS